MQVQWVALCSFVVVTTFTPGPNNISRHQRGAAERGARLDKEGKAGVGPDQVVDLQQVFKGLARVLGAKTECAEELLAQNNEEAAMTRSSNRKKWLMLETMCFGPLDGVIPQRLRSG